MSFLVCCSSRAPPGRLLQEEAAAALLRDECGPFRHDNPFDEFTALSFYREEEGDLSKAIWRYKTAAAWRVSYGVRRSG